MDPCFDYSLGSVDPWSGNGAWIRVDPCFKKHCPKCHNRVTLTTPLMSTRTSHIQAERFNAQASGLTTDGDEVAQAAELMVRVKYIDFPKIVAASSSRMYHRRNLWDV